MKKDLAEECKIKSQEITQYLIHFLNGHRSFKTRTFYGESFALNLIEKNGLLTDDLKNILIDSFNLKDKNDPEFHFEFNNYALADFFHRTGDPAVESLYRPLRFKGTKCTNWTLLRSNVRILENIETTSAIEEYKSKILNFQLKSGLILDDVGVKSFQYHCFSAAMLIEIYDKNHDERLLAAFNNAVAFIRKFILPNGEALYIGRGQEQSFGLGVLVYILAKYFQINQELQVLEEIKSVMNFISKFQYSTGSFPLVFTGLEKEAPENVDMSSTSFCGWYPYNNFFDYLPFMGFYLHKAYEVLNISENAIHSKIIQNQESFSDSNFIKIHKKNYIAILSRPGGYWSNDLPLPLIFYKDKFVTPMLGGEQFQKSLYTLEALSMPTTRSKQWSWRKFGKGFFWGNHLFWISAFGIMLRTYQFEEKRIHIKNRSWNWIRSEQNFSMLKQLLQTDDACLQGLDVKVHFSSRIKSIKRGYSAMGELNVVKTSMNVNAIVELC